eukprot:TRINITY_DN4841_c0_g1_i1.p1 TRINITY_DN4841_c0_g1~~TRINITY_DN4841_c0_g1_i1.p1  ORF type:complete len:862 (+),score=207.00 TRINITY_DN4841_c0_g1_i1:217-2586(+)
MASPIPSTGFDSTLDVAVYFNVDLLFILPFGAVFTTWLVLGFGVFHQVQFSFFVTFNPFNMEQLRMSTMRLSSKLNKASLPKVTTQSCSSTSESGVESPPEVKGTIASINSSGQSANIISPDVDQERRSSSVASHNASNNVIQSTKSEERNANASSPVTLRERGKSSGSSGRLLHNRTVSNLSTLSDMARRSKETDDENTRSSSAASPALIRKGINPSENVGLDVHREDGDYDDDERTNSTVDTVQSTGSVIERAIPSNRTQTPAFLEKIVEDEESHVLTPDRTHSPIVNRATRTISSSSNDTRRTSVSSDTMARLRNTRRPSLSEAMIQEPAKMVTLSPVASKVQNRRRSSDIESRSSEPSDRSRSSNSPVQSNANNSSSRTRSSYLNPNVVSAAIQQSSPSRGRMIYTVPDDNASGEDVESGGHLEPYVASEDEDPSFGKFNTTTEAQSLVQEMMLKRNRDMVLGVMAKSFVLTYVLTTVFTILLAASFGHFPFIGPTVVAIAFMCHQFCYWLFQHASNKTSRMFNWAYLRWFCTSSVCISAYYVSIGFTQWFAVPQSSLDETLIGYAFVASMFAFKQLMFVFTKDFQFSISVLLAAFVPQLFTDLLFLMVFPARTDWASFLLVLVLRVIASLSISGGLTEFWWNTKLWLAKHNIVSIWYSRKQYQIKVCATSFFAMLSQIMSPVIVCLLVAVLRGSINSEYFPFANVSAEKIDQLVISAAVSVFTFLATWGVNNIIVRRILGISQFAIGFNLLQEQPLLTVAILIMIPFCMSLLIWTHGFSQGISV